MGDIWGKMILRGLRMILEGVRVLACDIDGTLAYSDTEISGEMLEAISKLQEKYIFVTIGNSNFNRLYWQFIKKYSEVVGNDMYFFPLGGLEGYMINKDGLIKIYSNDFSLEEKYELINVLSDLIREENIVPETYDQIEDRGSMICLAPIGNKAKKESKKSYDVDKKKRIRLIEILKEKLGDEKYDFKIGGTTHIDITKKGFTKAYGVRRIKEILNCEFDEILFFGDDLQEGGNDFPVKEHLKNLVEVDNPEETLEKFREIIFENNL